LRAAKVNQFELVGGGVKEKVFRLEKGKELNME
jgi:hypothetical protein